MTSRWTGFHSALGPRLAAFLAQKRALGCRFRNEESPLRLLDRFLVEQHIETNDYITPAVIDAFLASRPRASPHSYNQLLGIVTRLFDWLVAHDVVSQSPVHATPRRTTASRLPFLFDPPTARRLLDAAGALPNTQNTALRGPTYRANLPNDLRASVRAGTPRRRGRAAAHQRCGSAAAAARDTRDQIREESVGALRPTHGPRRC